MAGARPRPPGVARARTSALVVDTLLLAHAAWCVGRLAVAFGAATSSFLEERPLLALVALPLALLLETGDASLGQRAHRLVRVTDDGRPAPRDRRAFAGLLALLAAALLALPLLLLGPTPAAWALAGAVALAWTVAARLDPHARSPAERLAGVRTVLAPAPTTAPAPWVRRPNAWWVLALLALTVAVGVHVAGVDPRALWRGADRVRPLVGEIVRPDWSVAGRVLGLMVETVFVALIATLLALPLAVVLGFVAAGNVTGPGALGRALYGVTRTVLNLTRSVEPVLWAIVFSVWVEVGPFAGTLALCVHSIASLAKLYSEALEGVDPGPVEAVASTGATRLAVLRWGLLPQVVPALLSFTVYRWDINVRMATILGFVGGGGIGSELVEAMQLSAWAKVGTIVVFVTAVVWLMDLLSARARRRVG